jgi:hypothetical protein
MLPHKWDLPQESLMGILLHFPHYNEFFPKSKLYVLVNTGVNSSLERQNPGKAAKIEKINEKTLVKKEKPGYSHTAW